MPTLHDRIAESFEAQGLMTTLGATLERVDDGKVHIALPFSAHLSQQHGFVHAGAITSILDTGKVMNAGRRLTVCTGEVVAYSDGSAQGKAVAVMQATIASVAR